MQNVKVVAVSSDADVDDETRDGAVSPTQKTRRRRGPVKQVSIDEGLWAVSTGIVLNPDSTALKSWDLVIIILLIYTSLVTPFEVALLETSFNALFFVNRIVDMLFVFDMFKNFVTAYREDGTGMWVVDNYSISRSYLRAWFGIDLASILPIDSAGLVMGSDTSKFKALRIVRLLRLMKLLRIIRAARILKRWEAKVGISFGTIALAKFGIITLVVAHWIACFYRLVPDLEGVDDNWLTNYYKFSGIGAMDEMKAQVSVIDQYITAFYWSWMTITTIGYGDVVSVTPMEKIFAIIFMIWGAGMYAYIVGGVCGIIANKDQATANFYRRMDDMNLYMSEHNVPPEVRVDMRSFQINCRELTRQQSYYSAINSLSPKLRGELMQHTSLKWICRVRIFSLAPEIERVPFMQMLASLMKPRAFSQGEVMLRQKDPLHHMLCIQRGVASQMMDGSLLKTLTKDNVVGEDLIVFSQRRSLCTVRAVTFVLAYELKKAEFVSVLCSHEFGGTRRAIRKELCRRVFRERFKIYAFTFKSLFGQVRNDDFSEDRHIQTIEALQGKTAFNYHTFSQADLEASLAKSKPLMMSSEAADVQQPKVVMDSVEETMAANAANKTKENDAKAASISHKTTSSLVEDFIEHGVNDDTWGQVLNDWKDMKSNFENMMQNMETRIQNAVLQSREKQKEADEYHDRHEVADDTSRSTPIRSQFY